VVNSSPVQALFADHNARPGEQFFVGRLAKVFCPTSRRTLFTHALGGFTAVDIRYSSTRENILVAIRRYCICHGVSRR
jgi:hypothetical protein